MLWHSISHSWKGGILVPGAWTSTTFSCKFQRRTDISKKEPIRKCFLPWAMPQIEEFIVHNCRGSVSSFQNTSGLRVIHCKPGVERGWIHWSNSRWDWFNCVVVLMIHRLSRFAGQFAGCTLIYQAKRVKKIVSSRSVSDLFQEYRNLWFTAGGQFVMVSSLNNMHFTASFIRGKDRSPSASCVI